MKALVASLAGLLALAAPGAPRLAPPPAMALLAALESGDLDAARATLAQGATIADSTSGRGEESSVAALSAYARGCTRTNLTWEYDAPDSQKGTVSAFWSCSSRAPSMTFIWTDGPRVVWVQFGVPAPQASE